MIYSSTNSLLPNLNIEAISADPSVNNWPFFTVSPALTIGILVGFYIIEEAVGLFNFEDSEENENKYYEDDDGNVYGKLPQFVVDAWKRDGKLW